MMSEQERQYELTGKLDMPPLPLDAQAQRIIDQYVIEIAKEYPESPTRTARDKYHATLGALVFAGAMCDVLYDEDLHEQTAEYHRWEAIGRALAAVCGEADREYSRQVE